MTDLRRLRWEAQENGLDVKRMSNKALKAWDRARRKGMTPAQKAVFGPLAAARGVSPEVAAGLQSDGGEYVQGWWRKAYWWVRWKLQL